MVNWSCLGVSMSFLSAVLLLCNKVPAELNSTFLFHSTLFHTQHCCGGSNNTLLNQIGGQQIPSLHKLPGSIVIDVLNGILN